MYVPGGFMAAGVFASRIGKNKSPHVEKSESVKLAEAESVKQMVELQRVGNEQDVARAQAKAEAEAKIGRVETSEERIERECNQFGYSMG